MDLIAHIPDDFGHWFAGFVDGEGCFRMATRNGHAGGICQVSISLRADDVEVLREIQRVTGWGKLYFSAKNGPKDVNGKPVWRWMTTRKAEAVGLVALFERYPLRSKKARDFGLWSEAVRLWGHVRGGGNGSAANDWSAMAALADALKTGRAYDPPEQDLEDVEPPQLALLDAKRKTGSEQ